MYLITLVTSYFACSKYLTCEVTLSITSQVQSSSIIFERKQTSLFTDIFKTWQLTPKKTYVIHFGANCPFKATQKPKRKDDDNDDDDYRLWIFCCFICSGRYHMAFKIVRTESRLVRELLTNHGFHEVMFPTKSCKFKRLA